MKVCYHIVSIFCNVISKPELTKTSPVNTPTLNKNIGLGKNLIKLKCNKLIDWL